MTYTTVQDLAAVVASAVELADEWPVLAGISGNKVSISQLLTMGEKIRGGYSVPYSLIHKLNYSCEITGRAFTIEKVKLEDLEKGILAASWTLGARHPSFSGEQGEEMRKMVLMGTLVGSVKGAWDVSDEMNMRLPEFKFTDVEEFLTEVWKDKA
jgi:hypothetical protein